MNHKRDDDPSFDKIKNEIILKNWNQLFETELKHFVEEGVVDRFSTIPITSDLIDSLSMIYNCLSQPWASKSKILLQNLVPLLVHLLETGKPSLILISF